MSVSGIGSSQGMMGMSGMTPPSPLTDDQKKTVASILSNYDSNNLTTSDAQDIFKKLKDAGITPTKGLKEAIESAGFDADKLRSLAFQGAQESASGTSSVSGSSTSVASDLTDDQKKTVASILSKYDSKNLTTDEVKSIITDLKKAGINASKGLKDSLDAAGFDSEKFRSLALSSGDSSLTSYFNPSQSTSSSSIMNTSALQTLQSILNQYDLSNMTTDQQTSLYTQLNSAGLLQSGNLLNVGV